VVTGRAWVGHDPESYADARALIRGETVATGTRYLADIWLKAVAFYRESVAARWWLSLDMLQLKFGLIGLAGDPSATPPDGINGIAAVLRSAMPRGLWNTSRIG